MQKIKQYIINISILFLALAFFFICGELFFRIFYPQPTYAVEYAPWGWRHIPNVSFVHGSEIGREFVNRIKYNSIGIRDYREFPYEKPKNIYRIEVFGDSYTEGVEVPYEKNICKVLEDELNANPATNGTKYEVMNFGVYAYDTAQELLYFKNEGVKYHPDLVIVVYTMDDPQNMQRGFLRLNNGKLEEHLLTVSKAQRITRLIRGYIKSHSHFLTFLINRIKFMKPGSFVKEGKNIALVHDLPYRNSDEQVELNIVGQNWEITSAIFKEFKSVTEKIGSKLLIVSTHIDPSKFKKCIDARQKLCDENGIYFLVSYDFSPKDLSIFHYALDGHWNRLGHARIARLIYDKIMNDKILPER